MSMSMSRALDSCLHDDDDDDDRDRRTDRTHRSPHASRDADPTPRARARERERERERALIYTHNTSHDMLKDIMEALRAEGSLF